MRVKYKFHVKNKYKYHIKMLKALLRTVKIPRRALIVL